MPFKEVQFASFITELWTLCLWYGPKGLFWWSFSGLRCQFIISSSLVSTHVNRMRLFDIFVKMGGDFGPLGLIYGHFGAQNGPKMAQNVPFCQFFSLILLGLCEPSKTWLSKSSLLRKRLSYNILGPSKPYRTGPLKAIQGFQDSMKWCVFTKYI